MVSSFPLIIFAYMYQVNIPMIYFELEKRNSKQMGKVLMGGTFSAVLLYALTGIFGYVTFVNFNDYSAFDALKAQNILEAPYANVKAITIGNFALFFAVTSAAPLVVLPAKDTVEEILGKDQRLTDR